MVTVVDSLKTNLLILEQQITDYYIDNILSHLQERLINNQKLTTQALTKVSYQISDPDSQEKFVKKMQLVRKQYHDNILAVQEQVSQSYETRLANVQLLIDSQQQELTTKEQLLTDLSQQKHTLDKKLVINEQQRLSSEQKLKDSNLQLENSQFELISLQQKLTHVQQNLLWEQKSLQTKEKSLKEVMSGNFHASLLLELENAQQQKDERDATINVLIRGQETLREQLRDDNGNLTSKVNALAQEIEELQALNDHLNHRLITLKETNQSLSEKNSLLVAEQGKIIRKALPFERENAKLRAQIVILQREIDQYAATELNYQKLQGNYQQLIVQLKQIEITLRGEEEKNADLRLVIKNDQLRIKNFIQLNQEQATKIRELNQQYQQEKHKIFFLKNWSFAELAKVGLITLLGMFALLFLLLIIRQISKRWTAQRKKQNLLVEN